MDSLQLITSIRYAKDQMDAVNQMTYFADYNWTENQNTLPAVFFYLLSFRTSQRNEMNTNTLIVYDSMVQYNENTTQRALTQVVADNCVAQPEECQMEILIPFQMQQMNYFWRMHDMEKLIVPSVANVMQNPIFKTLMATMGKLLYADDYPTSSDITGLLTNVFLNENLEQPDSLKAMADGRLPVQMKLPFGWKFRNGIITSLEMRKEPDEHRFMNASITMMLDPPILQVKEKEGIALKNSRNSIFKSTGKQMQSALKKIAGESE